MEKLLLLGSISIEMALRDPFNMLTTRYAYGFGAYHAAPNSLVALIKPRSLEDRHYVLINTVPCRELAYCILSAY